MKDGTMKEKEIDARRPKKHKLNLKSGFKKDDLKQLLASCNDMEGNHIMWVDLHGNIDITLLPSGLSPADWAEKMKDKIKFRYETFLRGNAHVGFEAARREEYVDKLYRDVINELKGNKRGLIDYWE
jgi:hypothetical protein